MNTIIEKKLNLINFLEFGAFFILFFVVLYAEGFKIGPIQFTLLWKFPLIIGLLLFVVFYPKIKHSSIFWMGVFFSLKYLIYPYRSANVLLDIIESIKYLVIPLFSDVAAYLFQNKKWVLEKLLLYLAIGLIWSSVPFLLGFLEPFESREELELELRKFGGEGQVAFVGGFGGPHNAAISITGALFVIISTLRHRFKRISYHKIFLVVTLLLGFSVLYQTYVRTGYICLVIGMIYFFLWRKPLGYYFKIFPLILLFLGVIGYKLATDPILLLRLTDRNVYQKKGPSVNQLGSGRGLIWTSAVNNWRTSPPLNVLFGNGYMKSLELMQQSPVGYPLVSHNGYLDVLQHTGLVGLFSLIIYFFMIFRLANRARDALSGDRLKMLLLLLVVSFFFQGGHFFWVDCMIAFSLGCIIIDERKHRAKQNTLETQTQ